MDFPSKLMDCDALSISADTAEDVGEGDTGDDLGEGDMGRPFFGIGVGGSASDEFGRLDEVSAELGEFSESLDDVGVNSGARIGRW